MVYIFAAFFYSNCFPKPHYSVYQLLLFFGFTSLLMYSLSSCHIFSIGFKSGDSAGVFHQLIPFSTMKSLAKCEVCLGSLSCMNLCDMGNFSWINGTRVASRICVNRNLSIIPSNTQMPVRPFLLIPAQTWTLTGCLVLLWNKENC